MGIVRTILIVILVGVVLAMIGGYVIIRMNARKPENVRKWTDPGYRD